MFDVVGLGCSCFDWLGVVPRLPGPDEEIHMLETKQQGGGEVATALVALARLGVSVAYVGKVGDDPFGDFIRKEFDRYGVDIRHLIVEPGAVSQASVVLVDKPSGKRTIVACVPTFTEVRPAQLPPGFIEQARYLHLDGVHRAAALEAARRARRAGVTVVLDADVSALDDDIPELIRQTDLLIPSQTFARSFAGTDDVDRAIDRLRAYGPSVVLVTLGDQGSRGYAEGRRFHVPAFPVEVVDTTGAGDVFHGALLYGMLQSWALEKSVEFASAVAAIKCTRLGGRTGIPNRQEAIQFLKGRDSRHFRVNRPEGSS